jgi:hypothetical protein
MTSTEYIKAAVSNMVSDLEEVMDGIEIIELEAAKIQALGIITKAYNIKVELMIVQNQIEVLKQYTERGSYDI